MSKKDYETWGEGQKLAKLDFEDLTPKQEEELKKAQDRVIKAINRNIRVALSLMSHKSFVLAFSSFFQLESKLYARL